MPEGIAPLLCGFSGGMAHHPVTQSPDQGRRSRVSMFGDAAEGVDLKHSVDLHECRSDGFIIGRPTTNVNSADGDFAIFCQPVQLG